MKPEKNIVWRRRNSRRTARIGLAFDKRRMAVAYISPLGDALARSQKITDTMLIAKSGSPNGGGNMRSLFVAVPLAGTLATIGVANAVDGCGPGCHSAQNG